MRERKNSLKLRKANTLKGELGSVRALINFLFFLPEAYCRKCTGSFLSITSDTSCIDCLEISLLKQLWASLQLNNVDNLQAQA